MYDHSPRELVQHRREVAVAGEQTHRGVRELRRAAAFLLPLVHRRVNAVEEHLAQDRLIRGFFPPGGHGDQAEGHCPYEATSGWR